MSNELVREVLRAGREALEADNREALTLYKLIKQARSAPRPAAVYRCNHMRDRCRLAEVYLSPRGPFLYSPKYRYSPEEAKRQGVIRREFPERAYLLDQLCPDDRGSPVLGFAVCRHRVLTIRPHVIVEDVEAFKRTGYPVRRFLPDGHAEATTQR
jgi:hypothetical protein